MRVKMQIRVGRGAWIEHRGSHQAAPDDSGPVVGAWCEGRLVNECVITGGERVVDDDFHAKFCQRPELIEVAEGVDEAGGPWIAAASGFTGLSEPDRQARSEVIAECSVEGLVAFSAREPLG